MAVFGGLLILVGLILFGLACVAFFKPLPKLKLATKRSAGLALLLSLGSCVVGTSLQPSTSDASAPATSKVAATESAAAVKTHEPAIMAFWEDFQRRGRPCDRAGEDVEKAFEGLQGGSGSIYDAYGAVSDAQERCQDAADQIGELPLPADLDSDQRSAFEKARQECKAAYAVKAYAYEAMAKVVDGDGRPSAVQEAKDRMGASSAGLMLCVANIADAAAKAGIPHERFLGSVKGATES